MAVDYYVLIRSAYLQNREASVRDRGATQLYAFYGGAGETDVDLYEVCDEQDAVAGGAREEAGVKGTGASLAPTSEASP